MEELQDRCIYDKYETARLLGGSPRSIEDARWRRRVGLRATRIGRSLRFLDFHIQQVLDRGLEPLSEPSLKRGNRARGEPNRTDRPIAETR